MTHNQTDSDIANLVRSAGSSFYWAMRLMPLRKRQAMYAIYAFCREVDDIADGTGTNAEKVAGLLAWRHEIDNVYAGCAATPIGQALQRCLPTYKFDKADFVAVIDGMQTDTVDSLRIPDLPALHLYCDQVACAVGRLSVKVFGISEPDGSELAKSLGEALQLTNILRDVDEDAERDHVYLPASTLASHEIDGSNAAKMVGHPGLTAVCNELAAMAGERFQEAENVLKRCNPSDVRPALIMMRIYRQIFVHLQKRGWEMPRRPIRMSKFAKLMIALLAVLKLN